MKNISTIVLSLGLITGLRGQTSDQPAAPALPGAKQSGRTSAATSVSPVSPGYGSGVSDSVPPLVINFSAADDAAFREIEEDLSIMTHLIEKSLGDDVAPDRMGIRMWATYVGRSIRAMHLENFGALFMIKVNMPVLAPAPAENKNSLPAPDSDWERAKQEVYRQTPFDATNGGYPSGVEYNAEQIEALKKALVGTLKNASRIRHLGAGEFIGITVFGAPLPAPLQNVTWAPNLNKPANPTPESMDNQAKNLYRGIGQIAPSAARASQQGTVLTLRVKKSDADDFSKGKIDFDAFEKTVMTNAYVGNGYGISSVNSWSRQGRGGQQSRPPDRF